MKNHNIGQSLTIDSDEVLIRLWDSYQGNFKITWSIKKKKQKCVHQVGNTSTGSVILQIRVATQGTRSKLLFQV